MPISNKTFGKPPRDNNYKTSESISLNASLVSPDLLKPQQTKND